MDKAEKEQKSIPSGIGKVAIQGGRLLRFTLLFLGLSGLGIYAVYTQVSGRSVAWDNRLFSPGFLASAAGLLLVYYAMDGLRLWFTLRALNYKVPLRAMVRLVFINIFVSNVTPLATGGGVAQVWFLQKQGVPIGTAMTATTIRTVLAVLFIFGIGPILLFQLSNTQAVLGHTYILRILLIFALLYIGFFFVLLFKTKILIRFLLGLLNILHKIHLMGNKRYTRLKQRIIKEMLRFADGFRLYLRGRPLFIFASIAATAAFLLSLFSFPALIAFALEYAISYWVVIGKLLITTFVMYFSPTPGASGVAEGVFAFFFSDVLSNEHLVLVTVLWRALTIYLGVGIGIFFTHHELSSREQRK